MLLYGIDWSFQYSNMNTHIASLEEILSIIENKFFVCNSKPHLS
jgi:hypothetical protein